jgi:hypothetical protein
MLKVECEAIPHQLFFDPARRSTNRKPSVHTITTTTAKVSALLLTELNVTISQCSAILCRRFWALKLLFLEPSSFENILVHLSDPSFISKKSLKGACWMIYVDRPILPTVNSLGTPFNKENKDSELNIRFASPGQSQASFEASMSQATRVVIAHLFWESASASTVRVTPGGQCTA